MSRSRKKNPVAKDNPRRSKRFLLRQAARRVRHCKTEIADGGAYRNLYDRYTLCDWRWRRTWPEYLRWAIEAEERAARWRRRDPKPIDVAAARRAWRKTYYNK